MTKLNSNLLLFGTVILCVSCIQSQPNNHSNRTSKADINPVTQSYNDLNIAKQKLPLLVDDSLIPHAPLYDFDNMIIGFLDPIEKDGYIVFSDTFIDGVFGQGGELDDGSNQIFYNDEPITISNCADLFKYDFNKISNMVSTGKNILAMRKRTCALVNEITQGTHILAKDKSYKNIEFKMPSQAHLNRIIKALPSWNDQELIGEIRCTLQEEYKGILCTDDLEDGYEAYLTQVARVNGTEYYYMNRYIGRTISLYYLVSVDSDNVEFEPIY